jgi:hypothetical protein
MKVLKCSSRSQYYTGVRTMAYSGCYKSFMLSVGTEEHSHTREHERRREGDSTQKNFRRRTPRRLARLYLGLVLHCSRLSFTHPVHTGFIAYSVHGIRLLLLASRMQSGSFSLRRGRQYTSLLLMCTTSMLEPLIAAHDAPCDLDSSQREPFAPPRDPRR